MNKRGIIIILYSVALLAVLSVILLATVQPKSFVVEVGQTHADIVRITEVVQNYNSYTQDAADIAYVRSAEHLNDREEFKRQFIFNFEDIMSNYPNFDDSEGSFTFSDRIFMKYNFEFGESAVDIIGIPELYLQYDYEIDDNNEIIFTEELVPDHYYVYSSNFETKIYPYFEVSGSSTAPESEPEESEE